MGGGGGGEVVGFLQNRCDQLRSLSTTDVYLVKRNNL